MKLKLVEYFLKNPPIIELTNEEKELLNRLAEVEDKAESDVLAEQDDLGYKSSVYQPKR